MLYIYDSADYTRTDEPMTFDTGRMKKLCEERGISETEFEFKLGISHRTMQRYKTGERQPPADVLFKMSTILETTTDYLLGRASDPRPSSGLTEDEWNFLNEYRARRLALQNTMFSERQALNELIATFPNESRYEVILFLTKLMKERGGKFNNLPDKH